MPLDDVSVITVQVPDSSTVITVQVPGVQGPPGVFKLGAVSTVPYGPTAAAATATSDPTNPNIQVVNLVIPAGPGMAVAGTIGDIPVKTGSADYAVGWTTPASAPTASTIVKRDASGRVQVADPSANADAATKNYVDNTAGTSTGTASTLMRRDATNGVSVGSVYVGNAPSGINHATRKDYVDTGDAATLASAKTYADGKAAIAGDLGGTAASPQVTSGAHHTHTSTQIGDATTVGKSLVTATDAPTARAVIGAGTSSVVIGTTVGTAKDGAYQPTSANISDATSAATASKVIIRDANGRASVVDPSVSTDIATKNYVDSVASKGTPNGVAALDANSGLLVPAYEDITELASPPANPAAGHSRLYINTNHRMVTLDSTGQLRPYAAYIGSGTAFPTTLLVNGDRFVRTDVGTNGSMWHYTGIASVGLSGWINDTAIACTSSTRPATAASYGGMTIYETDTGANGVYDAPTSKWLMYDTRQQTFTPTFAAGGPTAGSTGYNIGWYMREGKRIKVHHDFSFGAGSSLGTGVYRPNLPTVGGSVANTINPTYVANQVIYGPPNAGFPSQFPGIGVAYSGSASTQTWILNCYPGPDGWTRLYIMGNATTGAFTELAFNAPAFNGSFAGFGYEIDYQWQT